MRPVSAINTMKSPENASICDGDRNLQLWLTADLAISLRSVELARRATVKIARIMAGSAIAETVISRLLPRPPNELPVSRPARARKKRPSAKRYTAAITPPKRLRGASVAVMGIISPTRVAVAKTMYGAAEKIHDAVFGITIPLRSNLKRSR